MFVCFDEADVTFVEYGKVLFWRMLPTFNRILWRALCMRDISSSVFFSRNKNKTTLSIFRLQLLVGDPRVFVASTDVTTLSGSLWC